ncbi:MAG: endolytic transglycosylase MltG [Pseudomonadota bacterium]
MPVSDTNHNDDVEAARAEFLKSSGLIMPKSPSEALRPERVPLPPKRSGSSRSQLVVFLNFLMTLVVLTIIAAVAAVYFALQQFQAPGPLNVDTNFIVRPGTGIADISAGLERSNIITDARVFRYVTTSYLAKGNTLKAGEYEIKARSSMKDIMDLLESGKSIQYSLSIPEGLTSKQIFERLAAEDMLDGNLPAVLPPEGSMRADTYKFTRGRKRQELIDQMIAAQTKLVDEIWLKRDADLPLASKEEFVTLASIVEKETGKADERSRVAGVFFNRLKTGMRLQSDPTVIYGLFGGDGKPEDRPIYESDLKKKTPYNTYIIDALPPAPIATPGKAALEAVAHPSRTQDLYFVADGSGGHVFATNLEDHNTNVKNWRELTAAAEKEKAGQAAPTADEKSPTADKPADAQPQSGDSKKQKKKKN